MRGKLRTETLTSVIDPARAFEDEVHVEITNDSLQIHGTDTSLVGWVDVSLATDAFEAFRGSLDGVALNLKRISRLIRHLDADATPSVTIDPDAQRVSVSSAGLSYTDSLVLPESVPEVWDDQPSDWSVEVVVQGDALNPAVELADDITSHMTFGFHHDAQVSYVSAAGDTDSLQLEFGTGQVMSPPTEEVIVEYPLDKLVNIQSAIPDDSMVSLAFGNDSTLRIHYEFADGAGETVFRLLPVV
ncbi:hypothetical protein ACFQGT_14525 [Natrialbaceae archaeon GCM10025810]|uniref:hypothetical protein n=1 Tax=Halovalidus salilacus TaxID=3075124 RepID=UPI00360C4DF0